MTDTPKPLTPDQIRAIVDDSLTRQEAHQLIDDAAAERDALPELLALLDHWASYDLRHMDVDAMPDVDDAEALAEWLHEYVDGMATDDDTRRRGPDPDDRTGLTEPPSLAPLRATTPEALARVFARRVREELMPDELAEAIARNRTPEYANACATHDHRDANMIMHAAVCECAGLTDAQLPLTSLMASEWFSHLWNSAWTLAKAADFYTLHAPAPEPDAPAPSYADRLDDLLNEIECDVQPMSLVTDALCSVMDSWHRGAQDLADARRIELITDLLKMAGKAMDQLTQEALARG